MHKLQNLASRLAPAEQLHDGNARPETLFNMRVEQRVPAYT